MTYCTPYRKCHGAETWHWCENCPDWPRVDFEQRLGPPGIGQLCAECKLLGRVSDCEEAAVE
jgi:hypothetical protein